MLTEYEYERQSPLQMTLSARIIECSTNHINPLERVNSLLMGPEYFTVDQKPFIEALMCCTMHSELTESGARSLLVIPSACTSDS